MARTFVRVELEHADAERSFSMAMGKCGFVRTVRGQTTRRRHHLPPGMYLIERTGAVEALALTRQAARDSNVRARIFCLPVDGNTRFVNLQRV